MVRVQPVIARLWVRQAAAWRFGLPHRISAPQAQLGRYRVEAVGFGEFSCFIGFSHQALFAVDVVGGLCLAALFDGLGNPSAKRVMPVAGFNLRPALALLCAGIPDQPFGCVVFILFALERVAFLLRVPLRRVAHLRFHARVALKGRCGRVLRHLVVSVAGTEQNTTT